MCTTESRVYLVDVDSVGRSVRWMRPPCKMWACPECAEANKRKWQAIIAEGIKYYQANGEQEWYFITITSSGKLTTFNQTLYVFRKAWPKLYGRMKRIQPVMHSVYLPEKHKNGRLHFHAITTLNCGSRWLKDNAYTCGLGFKAETQELVSIPYAVGYVTKYITKSLEDGSQWPKSLHRVRTSQHWPKTPYEPENVIEGLFKPMPAMRFSELLPEWQEAGWRVIDAHSGEMI